jgi:RimJ/RimL family protein N-acetyltransferase
VSDGVITVRRFDAPSDLRAVLDGWDAQSERWLGQRSREPAPMACIDVGGAVVGWIDVDDSQPWLQPGEGNVGYCVFPVHRGNGYATRAVRLLRATLAGRRLRWALLVIDIANDASLGVARASGAQLRPERIIPEFPRSVVYGIELSRD